MRQNLGIEILSIIGCNLDMVSCEHVFSMYYVAQVMDAHH